MPSHLRSLAASLVLLAALGSARADSRPGGAHPDVPRLPKATVELYAHITLFPQSTKWLDIPWQLDLNEAIRAAKTEKRPVLIWVSGDDPLERC